MKNNPHIKVAWIVSLNTAISKFANYPFMLEIEDGRCYFYINSLLEQENPEKILEQVWYASSFIYEHVLNNETEIELLNKYKKNEMRVKKIVERLITQNREGKALLKQMKENLDLTEKDLLEVVNNEIMSLYEKNIEYVKKWWTENTVKKEGTQLKTNVIYARFVEGEENKKQNIDKDTFKQIMRSSILSHDEIQIGKSGKTQDTILNYGWIDAQ